MDDYYEGANKIQWEIKTYKDRSVSNELIRKAFNYNDINNNG